MTAFTVAGSVTCWR